MDREDPVPRSKSFIPSYRLHKHSGRAFVELDGRRYYLGPHADPATRENYDRLISEWLANGRQLPVADPTGLTITELCWRFWQWSGTYYKKPDGTPTSEREHYRTALRGLRHLFGTTLAAEFGPLDLKALRNAWVQGRIPRMRGPASRKYANEMTARVKRVFRWAAENELVPATVFQGLQVVKGLRKGRSEARETGAVRPVSLEDVVAIRPYLGRQVWDMVQVQLLSGARSGEIVILRPTDVDRTEPVWIYRPQEHKTGHRGIEREIYFGPKSQAILSDYFERPPCSWCFSPRESEEERRAEAHLRRTTPLSCGNRPGTNRRRNPARPPRDRYDSDSYRRAIQRACDKAGIRRWSPHQLRHTRGTEVRRDAGIEAAQVFLGHQRADVTQVYAERDRSLALEVARTTG